MSLTSLNPIAIGNALLKSLFTERGQIIVGTGSGTVSTLDPATNDYVLTLDSSTDTGLKWATIQPIGEIFLSMAGGWTGTTLPDDGFVTTETSTNKVNIRGTNFFATTSNQYHEFGCVIPHNYTTGTTITAKPVIFVPTSTDASNHTIILGLDAVCYGDGDTADAAYGTVQTSTKTVASAINGKVSIMDATAAITIAGTPAAGKWLQLRAYREGADTFAGDLTCLGWLITFTTSSV